VTPAFVMPEPDESPALPGPSGVVELSFAVASDLLVLARLAVSSVASRSGFDIEEIDDLRLAVDELCLSVAARRRRGRLLLHLDGTADQIEVWCHYDGYDDAVADPLGDEDTDDLSGRILDALVDEHGPMVRDGRHGARLCKRRSGHGG
jgi:hypothetical protein